jgi:hypothetical protein
MPRKMPLKSSTGPRPVKVSQPSFLTLPAEVRNMIYHPTLVAEKPLEVQDLHLSDFKAKKKNGDCRLRSTYAAPDHASEDCPEAPGGSSYSVYSPHWYSRTQTCSFKDHNVKFQKTSYTSKVPNYVNQLTVALLAVNHQIRLEAASIFYGINVFSFDTMSSVIPFLKDRTTETRKFVHSIQLNLPIYGSDWYSVTTAYNRPDTWKRVFASLAKLPHLSLKNVCIWIKDESSKMYVDDLELGTKHMKWLHQLSKINNLDKLGVAYTYGQWDREGGDPFQFYYVQGAPREERNSQTEQELWEFLAPKMLKAPDDLNALLERRIWDFENDPEADVVFDETANDENDKTANDQISGDLDEWPH